MWMKGSRGTFFSVNELDANRFPQLRVLSPERSESAKSSVPSAKVTLSKTKWDFGIKSKIGIGIVTLRSVMIEASTMVIINHGRCLKN